MNTTAEKFTPGPWRLDEREELFPYHLYIKGGEKLIASGMGAHVGNTPDLMKANARLIAAAPDLYDACKEFVRKVEAGEARSSASYKQMKAAIKKAIG